jgi:hypothetical protein
MAQFIRQHDWSAVVVEILVVIVGLMLAFQLDRWWEERGERAQAAEYVVRLINDIEGDVPEIEYAISLAELRLDMADLVMTASRNPAAAVDEPVMFLAGVRQSGFTYTPKLNSHTFEDLRSTGNMRLLLDLEIKDGLYDYYGFEETQSQFRPIQHFRETRHFELVAGVLSHEQAIFIQDNFFVVTPKSMAAFDGAIPDLDEVRASSDRLALNAAAIDWLPEVRDLQVEQIAMHKMKLEKADSVLQALRHYADSLEGAKE